MLTRRPSSVPLLENAVTSTRVWWAFCLFVGGLQALTHRHSMNPDGLSYLDMASDALIGGPSKLVNTYWSPAYSAVIGIGLLLLRPSPGQEIPLVHFINFLIFWLALCTFTFFFFSWLAMPHGGDATREQRKKWFVPLGFGMFLFFTVRFIGLDLVTPDLAVAAVVFLAAGLCCKMRSGSTWMHYAAIGCSLGLGYYVKAAMFPLALVLFFILFVWPPASGINRERVGGCGGFSSHGGAANRVDKHPGRPSDNRGFGEPQLHLAREPQGTGALRRLDGPFRQSVRDPTVPSQNDSHQTSHD